MRKSRIVRRSNQTLTTPVRFSFGENFVFKLSVKFPIISSDEKRDRRYLQAPIELLRGSPQLQYIYNFTITPYIILQLRLNNYIHM